MRCAWLVLFGVASCWSVAAADRLPQAGQEVHRSKPPAPARTSSTDDDDSGVGSFLGALFYAAFVIAWQVSEPQYEDYPYDSHADAPQPSRQNDQPQAPSDYTPSDYTPGGQSRPSRFEVNGDCALVAGFDDDVHWYGLRGRVHCHGFGVRGSWRRFGETVDGSTYNTDLLDLAALYRIYEGPYWNLEVGLGAQAYHDPLGTEWGALLGVSTDIFSHRRSRYMPRPKPPA